ncbi:RING-box protein 1a [Nymphaea thermarum]|nr:RING-box protein 1a [Nymphaea thermarum]
MASAVDMDVNMVPAGEGSSSSACTKKPKRFEIKKWNAVSLWAWGESLSHYLVLYETLVDSSLDIVVDNCAICRNHIMDLYNSEWEFQKYGH